MLKLTVEIWRVLSLFIPVVLVFFTNSAHIFYDLPVQILIEHQDLTPTVGISSGDSPPLGIILLQQLKSIKRTPTAHGQSVCQATGTATNKNAVHSIAGAHDSSMPKYSTVNECSKACCDDPNCFIWTYHTAALGGVWAKTCVLKAEAFMNSRSRLEPSSWPTQTNVISGRVTRGWYKTSTTENNNESNIFNFMKASNDNNNENNNENNNNEKASNDNNSNEDEDPESDGNDEDPESDGNDENLDNDLDKKPNGHLGNDENLDNDLDKKPNGHLGGMKGMIKQVFLDAFKPIQTKIASLEGKMLETHKKEEVDMSKIFEPLASKMGAIEDEVEQTGAKSAALKEKFEGIKKDIEAANPTNQAVGSAVEGIADAAQQVQKAFVASKEGVSGADQAVKKLSRSIDTNLGDVATSDGMKDAFDFKDKIHDASQEVGNHIKESIEKAIKSDDTHKGIRKTVKKNQKYLERIYKDLHHMHR